MRPFGSFQESNPSTLPLEWIPDNILISNLIGGWIPEKVAFSNPLGPGGCTPEKLTISKCLGGWIPEKITFSQFRGGCISEKVHFHRGEWGLDS